MAARFTADDLQFDPGAIALGVDTSDAKLQAAANKPAGPACQASLAGYRTALMFRTLFTSLVFMVALASAAALIFAIVRIVKDGADVAAIVTGVGGLLGSAGELVLVKYMNDSIKVAKQALADVGKYCGGGVQEQVK